MTDMPDLTLYYMPTCPFCVKVLKYMEQNAIGIPMKDIIVNSEYRQELLTIGGNTQVPCLVINKKPLYESDDIIQWFKDNL